MLESLRLLFKTIWIPSAVSIELQMGLEKEITVPNPKDFQWISIVNPHTIPHELLDSDLGNGETAVIALALEHPDCKVIIDDLLARQAAQAVGLQIIGTLKVLLKLKEIGFINYIEPLINALVVSGMWISDDIRSRILSLAGE